MKTLLGFLVFANLLVFAWIEWSAAANNCTIAVRPTYQGEIEAVAKRLQVKTEWLKRTILAESGGDPQAVNSFGHVGLIQFAPSTATALGFSAEEISSMSPSEQLKPIEAFYRPAVGRIRSYADMRMYTFFPLALGRPDSFVLRAPGNPAALVAKRNPSFDVNNDGKITVGEYKSKIK